MKKNIHWLPLFILCCLVYSKKGTALDAGVSCIVYATPEKPYVEVNLEIAAASVTFKRADSLHIQAGVNVLILVKEGNRVVNYEKYNLSSPLLDYPQNLLDVRRLAVQAGQYEIEINFEDMHDPANAHTYTTPLVVDTGTGAYLSDILLLRSYRPDNSDSPFTKNGYYLEPLPFRFYDRTATLLGFYAEVYHTNLAISGSSYSIRYVVEEEMGNGETILVKAGSHQKKPSVIDAILVPVNISKVKSGNYSLTVELRDESNALIATRKVFFQRSNPFLDVPDAELTSELVEKQFVNDLTEENLRYSLRAISPLMSGDDSEILKNILAGSDLTAMRYFLFRHFVQRNPNNPERVYLEYMKVAGAADQQFHSGFRYGFETDRGRVYMRYGRPDDLVHIEDDPSAPPYEIWVYYDFPKTQQKNVKFLFYNPTLAGEDFILLHSTARGEINNPRWEVALYQRNAGNQIDGNYHDATNMQRNIGRNARAFFEDF